MDFLPSQSGQPLKSSCDYLPDTEDNPSNLTRKEQKLTYLSVWSTFLDSRIFSVALDHPGVEVGRNYYRIAFRECDHWY